MGWGRLRGPGFLAERERCPRSRAIQNLERETGFEPATPTLARLCSTTELFPPDRLAKNSQAAPGCQAGESVFLVFGPLSLVLTAEVVPYCGRGQGNQWAEDNRQEILQIFVLQTLEHGPCPERHKRG